MSDFKLIPLYDAQAIFNTWPILRNGLEEVLKYTTGDTSGDKVLNDLLAGRLLAWMGWLDGEYVGFVTTRIDDIPTCYKALSIVHLYTKPGSLGSVFLDGMAELNEFAKERGCTKFRMWTVRDKAFNHVLEPKGWKQGYVEFIKEVD